MIFMKVVVVVFPLMVFLCVKAAIMMQNVRAWYSEGLFEGIIGKIPLMSLLVV